MIGFYFQFFKIGVLRDPFWNSTDPYLEPILPDLKVCLNNLSKHRQVDVIDPVRSPIKIEDVYENGILNISQTNANRFFINNKKITLQRDLSSHMNLSIP